MKISQSHQIISWVARWYMSAFLKDMLTLYPGQSHVQNIGFDSEGTHCKSETNVFRVELGTQCKLQKTQVVEDNKARVEIEKFLNSIKPTILSRIKSKIARLIK